jgi:hypothetical protein
MIVSLDGGETWVEAPQGVRVTYNDVDIPGEDEQGSLCFNFTEEGQITDVWVGRGDDDHNIGTSSEMVEEIVERLVEESA